MQAYAFVKHGLLENSLYIGHVLSYQTSIDREPRGCSIATFDLPLYSGDFHAGTIRNPCLGKLINNEHGDKNRWNMECNRQQGIVDQGKYVSAANCVFLQTNCLPMQQMKQIWTTRTNLVPEVVDPIQHLAFFPCRSVTSSSVLLCSNLNSKSQMFSIVY